MLKRQTSQRLALQEVFRRADRPLGVEEILKIGREIVESLNRATVYRNLKLLLSEGWLRKVDYPVLGTFYERTSKGHHHHFHCRLCDRLFELPKCPIKEADPSPAGFVMEGHEILLYGVCSSCLR
jgi:Fur family transcriptional regulator, ferric uptake regulator